MKKPLVPATPLMTRINVTPIIDVALVLVIILLITAPMMSVADVKLELPAAHSRDTEQPGYVTITIGRDGSVAVDDQKLASLDAIPDALAGRLADNADHPHLVVVRADEGLPYALVQDVMSRAKSGGATRLGLATRQGEDR
jgi:biopolymer transport protein ExbD